MERRIDGPDAIWSNKWEAAKWLGLSVPEFRAEAQKFPHLLPPHKIGKQHKWHWIDLARYNLFRPQGAVPEEEEDAPASRTKKKSSDAE